MKPENGDRKLEKGNDGRMEFWKCADKQADKKSGREINRRLV
jgi:hypothetical protein